MSVAPRDSPKTGAGCHTSQNQTQVDQFADSEELSRTLDTCRRQLVTASQQKVDLLRRCTLLTERVSSLELALAKSNQFAHYDELTGLPNRRLLLERFIQAAALADRHHQVLALLFFDVNDFKRVNDKLGHDAGDKLLQQLATRLSSSIRRSDTVCRYGGDEFVGLVTDIDHRNDAVTALQKIRAELDQPYVIDRYSIRLTVSDGLAIYPEDAQSFTNLALLADRSMFRNKSGNRRQSGGVPTSNIWLHDAGKESSLVTA
jgi:diguanylate cyclase (GGDEF)-like protein